MLQARAQKALPCILALFIAMAPGQVAEALSGWETSGLALSAALFPVDEAVARHLNERLGGRAAWADEVSLLGDPWLGAALAISVGLGDPRTGRTLAQAMLTAGAATLVLKWAAGVPRPNTGEPHRLRPFSTGLLTSEGAWPSGHTAVAFSLARVMAARHPDRSAWFYLAAGVVAVARVAGGYHWPSDVVAGAVVGMWAGDQAMAGPGMVMGWTF